MSDVENRDPKGESKQSTNFQRKGRKNKNRSKPRNTKSNKPKSSDFVGITKELKGYVFETFNESCDPTQYEETMKALEVYTSTKFRNGNDIAWMLKHGEDFVFTHPIHPSANVGATTTHRARTQAQDVQDIDQDIYKEKIKVYVARSEQYMENKQKLYSIIWGQYSSGMQSKLRGKPLFKDMDNKRDCILLIKEIKGIRFKFESQQYPIMSIYQAATKFPMCKKGKLESLNDNYKRFKTIVNILDHYQVDLWHQPTEIIKEFEKDGHTNITRHNMHKDKDTLDTYVNKVKNKAIAYIFLHGAQKDRYGKLSCDLNSQYSRKINQ